MDHFKSVVAQCPHNGLSPAKLSVLFGALLFCAATPKTAVPAEVAASAAAAGLPPPPVLDSRKSRHFLDVRLAADILALVLDYWPCRTSTSSQLPSVLLFTQLPARTFFFVCNSLSINQLAKTYIRR